MRAAFISTATLLALALGAPPVAAQVTPDVPALRPDAVVDLRSADGVRLVQGTWRYADAHVQEVDHRAPGADLRASGAPVRTHDIHPRAGVASFDDAAWPVIAPESLEARRGNGRLSFGWYRLGLTIPDKVGGFDPTGSTVVFEIVVDDYAEVWVDGRLPVVLGQAGGPLVRGFNAPNRVVLTRDARPGQRIQLAVFAANGPLSDPPANFIWVRSATLDFHRTLAGVQPVEAQVVRLDPALDAIVPSGAMVERVATGFIFGEGPVWHPDGYLLFSDPNANVIYRWAGDGQVSVFRTKSGYAGADIGEYHQPGSNGLTLDADGRLTIAEHGRRRISRLERNGTITVLADRFEGKRLNSPNDLVYASDGSLYFTDPAFGLPKVYDDPRKELPAQGVFRWNAGRLELLTTGLKGPNGIALSPDERFLYVANWDEQAKVVMRYPRRGDGTVGSGVVFADLTTEPGEEALDGLKVDQRGNVYVSGPGGLWIFAPDGRALGRIVTPQLAANFAWGDDDGRTLYLTARSELYRVRLNVPGVRPWPRTGLAEAAGR